MALDRLARFHSLVGFEGLEPQLGYLLEYFVSAQRLGDESGEILGGEQQSHLQICSQLIQLGGRLNYLSWFEGRRQVKVMLPERQFL